MPLIALHVHRVPHSPAAQIGYALTSTRIVAHIAIQTASGWTRYRPGIVDTGAAVSLFPAEVWRGTEHQLIATVRVGGIVARDECRISARLATLSCVLSDGVQVIGPLTIHAYLAESDEVPLLLGTRDLIESGILTIDLRKNQATFEQ